MTTENSITFYPGVGADEGMAELYHLVGQITATWAQVEDGLFGLFVIGLAGTWVGLDHRPYRAVFFTFNSYEQKMRILNNALKERYRDDKAVLAEWKLLRGDLNDFNLVRNSITHLSPMAKSFEDPLAPANVRLVPPFWKSSAQGAGPDDFDSLGYSAEQLWEAIAPFWGYHPMTARYIEPRASLAYRVQEFTMKLLPPPRLPNAQTTP